MRRRHFLTFATGAFLSASAQAQQAGGLRRVGVLFPGVFGEEREKRLNEGLASELGTERVTVIIKSAAGDSQSLFKYARELVDSRVDVIVAIASGSLEAARRATQTIPIVALDLESDPIAIGAAQSLNRPGGNVTGVFFDAPEIASKWIQIIRELVPHSVTPDCFTTFTSIKLRSKPVKSLRKRWGSRQRFSGSINPVIFAAPSKVPSMQRSTQFSFTRRRSLWTERP
jgi:hypothetical protein